MGTVTLDANVLIAFLDPADEHHSRAIDAVRLCLDAGDRLVISAIVYAEVLVQPLRLGLGDTLDAFISETNMHVVPVDRSIARYAAVLRTEHPSLRLPDALILATALTHRTTLLTFHERLNRCINKHGVDADSAKT